MCRISNTIKIISTHRTSQINAVPTRMLRFSRGIVFLYRQYGSDIYRSDDIPRSTTEHTDECLPIVPALCQIIKSLFQSCSQWQNGQLQRCQLLIRCHFVFDGINATAQHVMAQTAPIDAPARLLRPVNSSKTIVVVKFRRLDVPSIHPCLFLRKVKSEIWNIHSLTHSLTSRPTSIRVGDSRRPLRYLSSPLCSIL